MTIKKSLSTNEFLSPAVGIFWLYQHEIVFSHFVPLAVGPHYGEAVTGTKDHADYWEELRNSGKLAVLPQALQEEYFSIPRGRVVYHSDTDTFFVYHGNNVSKSDLNKVCKLFNLPKQKTKFEQDFHYCDVSADEWNLIYGK
ncbi:hypothetical protein [uncultured Treponema sp.]|uniref:hypothetical protein n=1 Tax=uncultured Treponema sp. TaxID=162155 RepID=UPI0025FD219D|nr:hypothetical protein [uncultured Treponema sp.]